MWEDFKVGLVEVAPFIRMFGPLLVLLGLMITFCSLAWTVPFYTSVIFIVLYLLFLVIVQTGRDVR